MYLQVVYWVVNARVERELLITALQAYLRTALLFLRTYCERLQLP